MVIAAKIFSILGNSQSLVPLAVKDSANCTGMTLASSITSKEEGKDRLIDEVGTGGIWLLGIPLYKKGIDSTVFKIAKLDPKYDVRNLKNKEIYEKTKEYAPTEKIKKNIEKIGNKSKAFKNLNVAKFVLATVLTLGTYNLMTDWKQRYTHKKVTAKLVKQREARIKDMNDRVMSNNLAKKDENTAFQSLGKMRRNNGANGTDNKANPNSPNFTGLYNIMLDPVKNTMVLDGGITSQRLGKSRSWQEVGGYAIKEGGFLFFMYILGKKIQDHFEKTADCKHKKNISLDARVLEDENFKQSFADNSIENSLKAFEKYSDKKKTSDLDLYEFIHKNPDNMVISSAKQSDIIQTYKEPKKWYQIFTKPKDTGKIDTRKYIDLNSVRDTYKSISKLHKQFQESGETVDEFFKGVRKLKRKSIIKNIGSTIFALGVVLPGIMLADRFLRPNNKEFAVEKEIRAQLEKDNNNA